MAISANGFIAKEDDSTNFISKAEWESYSMAVRQAGNVIMGHRTYEIITKQPEFAELKDVKVVIISRNKFRTLNKNHLVAHSTKEAISLLQEFREIIVAGGSQVDALFIKNKLVDEIYLDVEPIIIGKGIPLFALGDFELNLELLGTKLISKNEIQIHYKVIR